MLYEVITQNGQSGITDPGTPEQLKAEVTLYFTDEDIMDLKPVEREITYTDANDKYETAFKALQMADEGLISLWDKVELNALDVITSYSIHYTKLYDHLAICYLLIRKVLLLNHCQSVDCLASPNLCL